jgi:phosphoribosyl-ATP pyrophosphohydrolase/phosphoribosyl-AMP cyclohydrolase/histidinol dehydrogenase
MQDISCNKLKILSPENVKVLEFDPVDSTARDQAAAALALVKENGRAGLLELACKFGDIPSPDSKYVYDKNDLKAAFDGLTVSDQEVLRRTASRIRTFAMAQRSAINDMETAIPGGKAGHMIAPVKVAGCYAPGGRYPLPSSVLMTAVTARVAGVETVWIASPRPAPATLAAAYIADADGLLCIGGAQAIGAMAYGVDPVPPCDVIVGPGNKWVTAAKSLVSGLCAIDMLAGPSEVLVIADETCNTDTVAADLLAQAEHDTEARPIVISTSSRVVDEINERLQERLSVLPTRATANEAVAKGFACVCSDINAAIALSDIVGPEHLEIHTENAEEVGKRCQNYGGLFIGTVSAEVLGDYGAGPNHVLPTSGTSRYTGGLSVFTFLRIRTWMNILETESPDAQTMINDCVSLARIEGLEGHARAAECRLKRNGSYDSSPLKKSKT